MPIGVRKAFDMTMGICMHGLPCCPHVCIGYAIPTQSPDTYTDALQTSRAPADLAIHTCPHCPINMAIQGSSDVIVDNLMHHRLGDMVTEFCGIGFTITASSDHFDD